MTPLLPILIAAALALTLLSAAGIWTLPHARLWLHCRRRGAPVPLGQILGMRLRRVDPMPIIDAHIRLTRAGLSIPIGDIENHALAAGDVPAVADAMLRVHEDKLDIDWKLICAIDISGHDIRREIAESARRGENADDLHQRLFHCTREQFESK